MTISQRIFDLLRQTGQTQTALANAIGVRIATVTGWKNHGCDPQACYISAIANFFNVTCDYICTGKDSAPPTVHQQGIFGNLNKNNTVTISGDGAVKLTEFESELLRVYSSLDARGKNALLTFAYNLEGENK